MNIVVSFRKVWGKDLFYPVSKDAIFITKITGRPTILRHQLKLFVDAGWKVSITHEVVSIEDHLKDGK